MMKGPWVGGNERGSDKVATVRELCPDGSFCKLYVFHEIVMKMEISDTEPYVLCADRIHVDRTNSINVLAVEFHGRIVRPTPADLIGFQLDGISM